MGVSYSLLCLYVWFENLCSMQHLIRFDLGSSSTASMCIWFTSVSTQSAKSQAVQQQNWQNWNDNTSRHWKKSRSYSTFSQPELRTMNKKSYFFLQSMWLLNVLRGPLGNNNAKGVGPWLRDEIMSSLVGSYRTLILWLNVFKQLDMAG